MSPVLAVVRGAGEEALATAGNPVMHQPAGPVALDVVGSHVHGECHTNGRSQCCRGPGDDVVAQFDSMAGVAPAADVPPVLVRHRSCGR